MCYMESFRFTADLNSFNNNQPNLIPFRFVYFVSFVIILQPKFKSGITTNKQTYSWVSHKLLIWNTWLCTSGRVWVEEKQVFELAWGKNKKKLKVQVWVHLESTPAQSKISFTSPILIDVIAKYSEESDN